MKTPILVIIFSIIFWSLFFNFAKAQPGPIQIQESGINNYQIQATTPTTTPIAGKQYLYNANDVLSTKDSLNNVQRVNKNYDNYIPNFDLEQGLTPYVFTAGRSVINTAIPLEGLKSLDFDATALNDFIETPLITIPRVLMGNTCMIKVAIRGSDANLQLQLINGAGTIIAFKQLAVYPSTSNQFLTFNCPTQALITGTPALGQLKIKIVQSTATNSALATLDSFYLGRFESNTMTVQEQPQWLYINRTADINAQVPLTPSTAIQNDNALFTYTGVTLTMIKPALVHLNINAASAGGVASNEQAYITCTINGTSRSLGNSGMGVSTAGTTSQGIPSTSADVNLSPGDTCVFQINRAATTITGYTVSMTATPLPQLATIVNTKPSELSARITSAAVITSENDTQFLSTCVLNSAGDFTCNFQTPYQVIPACRVITEDNTNTAKEVNIYSATVNSVSYRMFSDTNVLTSYAHNLECSTQGDFYNSGMFEVLQPQYQSYTQIAKSGESCDLANNGVASITNASGLCAWIQSVTRQALGQVRLTWQPNVFNLQPNCNFVATSANLIPARAPIFNFANRQVDFYTESNAGTAIDGNMTVFCEGKK